MLLAEGTVGPKASEGATRSAEQRSQVQCGSAEWTKQGVGGYEVRLDRVSGHREEFNIILRAMGSRGRLHSRGVAW